MPTPEQIAANNASYQQRADLAAATEAASAAKWKKKLKKLLHRSPTTPTAEAATDPHKVLTVFELMSVVRRREQVAIAKTLGFTAAQWFAMLPSERAKAKREGKRVARELPAAAAARKARAVVSQTAYRARGGSVVENAARRAKRPRKPRKALLPAKPSNMERFLAELANR
jgi:hypothetical protein